MKTPYTTLLTKHRCRECGAEIDRPGPCWLCNGIITAPDLVQPPPLPLPGESPFAPPSPRGPVQLGLTLAAFVMVVVVGIGTYLYEPILGVVYLILVTPATIAAAVMVLATKDRPNTGESIAARIVTVMATFALTIGIILVLGVVLILAAIIALIATCFYIIGTH
ncbi:hypothetical protein NA78x_005125 [Anatilimnocola sp. NA78]|uniref:hypothetical protein n=1 Tax=Anatilimnocola sp. NA78 TaxID=3415683 RepID=UPI003CE452BB